VYLHAPHKHPPVIGVFGFMVILCWRLDDANYRDRGERPYSPTAAFAAEGSG